MTNATEQRGERAKARVKARRRSIGAVMVEYALLLTFVAVPTVVGLTAAGVILYNAYLAERNHLLYPTP